MWIGLFVLLIAGSIGGTTPVVLKIGLNEFPPLILTTLRFLLATIVFLPFYFRQKPRLFRSDITTLSTQSIFFALNVGFFSIAIQFTTAIMSQILYTLVPIIVMILSYYMLKEKLTTNKIVGLAIAILGVAFLMYQSAVKEETLTFGTPFGNTLTLCGVFSWALYLVFSKKLTNRYSPTTTSFASYVVTTLLLLFLVPIEYTIRPLAIEKITITGIESIFWLAIISSALMFFLIQFAVQKTTAFTASFFQYLGPFSGALVAIPILGEKPTWTLVMGGLFIITGVFYATSYEHARKYLRSVLQ